MEKSCITNQNKVNGTANSSTYKYCKRSLKISVNYRQYIKQ